MKVREIPRSGKRGQIVAFRSRFGQCEREHRPTTKRPTAAQRLARSAFGGASLGWNRITEEQRDAWCEVARTVHSHPRGGQSGPLTGQNLFTAINRNQALLGLPPFVYPPDRPEFSPSPVKALTITDGPGGPTLKLTLAQTPAADILVFASPPHNAGRRYCDKFKCLGPLRAPIAGKSNITAQYLTHHPKPWPGSRVILHIVQQVNGWRDRPRRIEAVFRPAQPPPPQPNRLRRTPAPH